ncbi:MAG: MraY family glycosyltransferase [Tepidisphaeraceae bacterium]|jgi:UDP-GlcNAc:undecaprenyl-phosphate GlcNAc-1-phosphate transferase
MRLLIPPLILPSFALSFVLTLLLKRLAPRFDFVDKPGQRKIHHTPKPLGGGIAVFLAIVLPVLAALTLVHFHTPASTSDPQSLAVYWAGIRHQTPLALKLILAMAAVHVLGLADDRRAMGPMSKLIAQLAIITTLVVGADIRALTFLDHYTLGRLPSIVLTVLWITAITNAFNFLDNMDGLSAGIAAVASTAFLVAALLIGQWFVAALLAMLLGALLGFLCFNFSPASIFLGDSGSTLIGLLLGVLTIRTTYLLPGKSLGAGWYSVFVPVIVLAIPLYDLVVVSIIRIRNGKSPFVGDTNHLSHRLVRRGMSRRMAVLCIYLMTAATSSAAIVLPHVDSAFAAFALFAQTFLILGVVAVLEQHPLPQV